MMSLGPAEIAGVATAGLVTGGVLLLLPLLRRGLPLDMPNERSLHAAAVPRVGGQAMAVGIALALALFPWQGPDAGELAIVLACAGGLLLLSLFDDWRGLPAAPRLAGHLAAAFVAASLFPLPLPWLLLAAIAIGWMTNLFNFMDGSDGLAGGMAAIGFGCYGIAALAQAPLLAATSLALAAAAVGFLFFNFQPARVFMGDAGSIPLGFLAGALGLLGWQEGVWPAWFPPLVFSPFIVDATVTLLRRALRGERVWQAHREHYYQRLVLMGWGHRRTALVEYAVMFAAGASALLLLGFPARWQWAGLGAWACAYVGLARRIDHAWAAAR